MASHELGADTLLDRQVRFSAELLRGARDLAAL
jgi:hypothetical protein